MPSPFPGMDPYLEQPAIFPGLHDRFVAYLSELIQRCLPDPYYAEIADRVWVEVSDRMIGPDVNVLRGDNRSGVDNAAGGVAVEVDIETQPVVITVPHDEIREPFVEIHSRLSGERLVTTIEVLSLTNKTPGAKGRDLYLQKQRELLDSQTHLIEIDLLRAGEHTTGVPLDRARKKIGAFDYHVCGHEFDHFEDFLIYPIPLRKRLPEISVPLLPGDSPVRVDLQAVLDRAYDTGPYRRRVRYQETAPEPVLQPNDQTWASDRIREWLARGDERISTL